MSDLMFQLPQGGWTALRQEDGKVTYEVQGGGREAAPCMWFALCDHEAITTEHTPVAGDVPICERCHRRMFPERYEGEK